MEKIETAKHEIEKKAPHVLATLIRGAEAAVGVGTLIRALNRASMTSRWPFFRPRRTFWGALGLVGVGVAAGAGLSMFLSPMSGRQTREGLLRGFRNIGRKGKEILEDAEEEIAEIAKGGHDGEKAGGKQQREGSTKEASGREGQGKEGSTGKEGSMREGGPGKEGQGKEPKSEQRPGNATGRPGEGRTGGPFGSS